MSFGVEILHHGAGGVWVRLRGSDWLFDSEKRAERACRGFRCEWRVTMSGVLVGDGQLGLFP